MLTVGILGGMGPLATVDLFAKIVRCTPASFDQDHLKIIVYNNPQIPSRVDALLHGGESPCRELVRAARFLESAGADLVVMPCNTAHYWFDDLRRAVGVRLINMIDNTAAHLAAAGPAGQSVLFATAATVAAGLYQKAFAARSLALSVPGPAEQAVVSLAIDAVKAGKIENNPYLGALDGVIASCRQAGAGSFIAGCTEIPLLFPLLQKGFRQIDPTLLLAREVIRQATAASGLP